MPNENKQSEPKSVSCVKDNNKFSEFFIIGGDKCPDGWKPMGSGGDPSKGSESRGPMTPANWEPFGSRLEFG